MLETRGDQDKFVEAIGALGCEYAMTGDHRVKIVLQEGIEVRDLYRLAAEQQVQIRRLELQARFAGRHLPEGNGERPWRFMSRPTSSTPAS